MSAALSQIDGISLSFLDPSGEMNDTPAALRAEATIKQALVAAGVTNAEAITVGFNLDGVRVDVDPASSSNVAIAAEFEAAKTRRTDSFGVSPGKPRFNSMFGDTQPWYSADAIVLQTGSGTLGGCTNGASSRLANNSAGMVTAAHCGSIGDATYNDVNVLNSLSFDGNGNAILGVGAWIGNQLLSTWSSYGVTRPIGGQYYGDLQVVDVATGKTVEGRIYVASGSHETVAGATQPVNGTSYCFMGIRETSPQCGYTVDTLATTIPGTQVKYMVRTHKASGGGRCPSEGDSGGTVFTNASANNKKIVGILSASDVEGGTGACYMWFTSEQAIFDLGYGTLSGNAIATG